jgi:hypothetical protein
MVLVLLQPDHSGASVQRRYIEAGKFDFCIDGGERVTQLTSDPNGWPNIEAGQKIVMRVIFEQVVQSSCTYTCAIFVGHRTISISCHSAHRDGSPMVLSTGSYMACIGGDVSHIEKSCMQRKISDLSPEKRRGRSKPCQERSD